MKQILKEWYNYRELFKTSIKKEVRGKYKGAWLGLLWTFLNPLFQTLVIATVFTVMKIGPQNYQPYVLFLSAAQIPWFFFVTALNQSTFSIVANGGIVKKVYFPREIIPFSVVFANVINALLSTIIIMLISFFTTGVLVTWYIVFIPVVLFVETLLLLVLSLFTSSITVYFRDFEHILNVMLQALYYLTPIMYALSDFDSKAGKYSFLIRLNPMTHITEAYRSIFYFHQVPDLFSLGILVVISLIGFVVGVSFFRKLQKNFAEEF